MLTDVGMIIIDRAARLNDLALTNDLKIAPGVMSALTLHRRITLLANHGENEHITLLPRLTTRC